MARTKQTARKEHATPPGGKKPRRTLSQAASRKRTPTSGAAPAFDIKQPSITPKAKI